MLTRLVTCTYVIEGSQPIFPCHGCSFELQRWYKPHNMKKEDKRRKELGEPDAEEYSFDVVFVLHYM